MENIRFKKTDGVGLITLSRPERLNALSRSMLRELEKTAEEARKDETLRCLVITGEGGKAFAAGADIAEMSAMSPLEAREFSHFGSGVLRAIESLPIPVIAAVNGYALGGGCELALCCDIRVASENAFFGQPEAGLGIIPGFGGTQRLARAVGMCRAKKMIFTGEKISAREALAAGLVCEVVPEGEAAARALQLAQKILRNPPMAVRFCKSAVGQSGLCSLDAGLAYESELFAGCFAGPEQKAGMQAFLNRQKKHAPGEKS